MEHRGTKHREDSWWSPVADRSKGCWEGAESYLQVSTPHLNLSPTASGACLQA